MCWFCSKNTTCISGTRRSRQAVRGVAFIVDQGAFFFLLLLWRGRDSRFFTRTGSATLTGPVLNTGGPTTPREAIRFQSIKMHSHRYRPRHKTLAAGRRDATAEEKAAWAPPAMWPYSPNRRGGPREQPPLLIVVFGFAFIVCMMLQVCDRVGSKCLQERAVGMISGWLQSSRGHAYRLFNLVF
jgi:hypothetical protein